jgi:hypothetical protein
MKKGTKQGLQSLGIWLTLMTVTYFAHGFPNLWWFAGFAWCYLILSGIIVLVWEHFFGSIDEESPSE